jgi:hypothetical protein
VRRPALAAVALWLAGGTALAAEPVRLLVSIGSNIGDPEDPPLRFAEDDAHRVAQLFVDIGQVDSTRAEVVVGQDAAAVRERLAEMAGRVKELRASGEDTALIVYASGHARDGALHLRGTHLSLQELRAAVEASGATLKLLVIDACDAGAIARSKGATPGPEFAVSFRPLPLSGMAIITSSGPTEASQEWDSLQGSLFTHHLLTGLRGDADGDGDGQVSLSEAYAYTWRRTVVNASRSGQHPAFELDLSGTGDLVLAVPRAARSAVVFPAELEGRFVLASQPRADVVAEVDKVKGRALRLAVPPGRYVVRKALGAQVGVMAFSLSLGGERTLDERELQLRHFAEVAVKGGFVEPRPSTLAVVASLESPPLWGNGPRVAGGVSYRLGLDAFWVAATARAWAWDSQTDALTTREVGGALRAAGGTRFLQWPVVPWLGAFAEGRLLTQRYERAGEQGLQQVFGVGPLPARTTAGLALGLVGGLELPLGDRWVVLGEVEGLARWLRAQDQPAWTAGVSVQLGLGVRL